MDVKGLLILAVAAIIIYSFVLSPETKTKVGNTASAAQDIGQNLIGAGQNLVGVVTQKDLGKPNCTTNQQCQTQFGNNTMCETVSGKCFEQG